MSLFAHTRRTVKEVALVITADVEDEMKVIRTKQDQSSASTNYVTAQQMVFKNKLAGFQLILLNY